MADEGLKHQVQRGVLRPVLYSKWLYLLLWLGKQVEPSVCTLTILSVLFYFTLQRWSTILLEYDLNIEYRKIAKFGQAECPSHLIYNQICTDKKTFTASLTTDVEAQFLLFDALRKLSITTSDIQDVTVNDSVLKNAMKFVRTEWLKSNQKSDLL
ncbi:unnamed protein product [Hymenolepis diminuta]|uniref:Uncharacterized protein n=1 Tax=Hymenolepis diminuta TaxID=6216 RepID=A0A3P6ZZ77_HYMDI|nr:unnamed protein product [Hymenolepis diminuta]